MILDNVGDQSYQDVRSANDAKNGYFNDYRHQLPNSSLLESAADFDWLLSEDTIRKHRCRMIRDEQRSNEPLVYSHFNSSFDGNRLPLEAGIVSHSSIKDIVIDDPLLSSRISRDERIISYFCKLLQLTCGVVTFPGDLEVIDIPATLRLPVYWRHLATAIEYFKRFYVNNSLLHFDPRIIMIACLFLASKVENHRINVKDVLRLNNGCQDKDVFQHEDYIVMGLGYQLKVEHSLSSNHVLLADFKRQCPEQAASSIASMHAWETSSRAYLDVIQVTSASLTYLPSMIAFSSLLATEPPAIANSFQAYLLSRFGAAFTKEIISQHETLLKEYYIPMISQQQQSSKNTAEVGQAMKELHRESRWGSNEAHIHGGDPSIENVNVKGSRKRRIIHDDDED